MPYDKYHMSSHLNIIKCFDYIVKSEKIKNSIKFTYRKYKSKKRYKHKEEWFSHKYKIYANKVFLGYSLGRDVYYPSNIYQMLLGSGKLRRVCKIKKRKIKIKYHKL